LNCRKSLITHVGKDITECHALSYAFPNELPERVFAIGLVVIELADPPTASCANPPKHLR